MSVDSPFEEIVHAAREMDATVLLLSFRDRGGVTWMASAFATPATGPNGQKLDLSASEEMGMELTDFRVVQP